MPHKRMAAKMGKEIRVKMKASHPWDGEIGRLIAERVSLPIGHMDAIELDNGQKIYARRSQYIKI